MRPVVLDGQSWYVFSEVCSMLHVSPRRARRFLPPTPLHMLPRVYAPWVKTKIAVIRREDVETLVIRFSPPLRAQTMQGPRVTLAASEQIDDPWTIEFTVKLIGNPGTRTSAPITWEAIETALDYGSICGALGQWRNGGYGRFTWISFLSTSSPRRTAKRPASVAAPDEAKA